MITMLTRTVLVEEANSRQLFKVAHAILIFEMGK